MHMVDDVYADRRAQLVAFIRHSLKLENYPGPEDESGELLAYLDSVLLLQLVLFIEERFKITLDMGEVDLEDFKTIDTLLRALDKKG
jgi:acyl carrier protein